MKSGFILSVMFLALQLGKCAAATASMPIINGTAVEAGDPVAASTVFLAMKKLGRYEYCTGSLIDTDMIVTAGHCVSGASNESIQIMFTLNVKIGVLVGTPTSTSGPDSVRQIYGTVVHPDYSTSGSDRHDIAVVRFQGAMPEGYQPAKLLPADTALVSGEEVVIAGYGSTHPIISGGEGQLNKATIEIDQPLGQAEIILNEKNGSAACWGDSGGPAFVQSDGETLLWGVTNRGYPDSNTCLGQSVYTQISKYADFIAGAEATLRRAN
jgi:secreted trypsin-like serine protease